MGASAEGERDPCRTGVVVRPRLRDEPRAPDGHRPRRFEPFPRWGYVLFAITAVVTPVAVYLAFRDHAAPDGTSCGAALFPTEFEGQAIGVPCVQVIADAQPWALALGVVAVALVMTSITTLIVRGWIPRDASTAD